MVTVLSGLFGAPTAAATVIGPSLSVALSTLAAGVAEVTYLLDFTAPVKVATDATITVTTVSVISRPGSEMRAPCLSSHLSEM